MSYDTVVDEVRAIREAYSARFQFNPDAIYRDIKEQEKKSGRNFVSPPPKRYVPRGPAAEAAPAH